MKISAIQKLEPILLRLIILLIPVHMVGSYVNAIDSIDKGYGHSYSMATYVLIALWLLIVVAVDTFTIINKGFICSKVLSGYWMISTVILAVVLVFIKTTDSVLIALLILITPYGILFPLFEVFFIETTTTISLIVIVLFCLLNWCICKFAPHRGEPR